MDDLYHTHHFYYAATEDMVKFSYYYNLSYWYTNYLRYTAGTNLAIHHYTGLADGGV